MPEPLPLSRGSMKMIDPDAALRVAPCPDSCTSSLIRRWNLVWQHGVQLMRIFIFNLIYSSPSGKRKVSFAQRHNGGLHCHGRRTTLARERGQRYRKAPGPRLWRWRAQIRSWPICTVSSKALPWDIPSSSGIRSTFERSYRAALNTSLPCVCCWGPSCLHLQR